MVRIRLRRVGAKRQASYRIVVTDQRSPRDGRYIEILGYYNPRTQPETIEYKEDRALHWLSNGAQPSEAVRKFFERNGTYDRLKRLHAGEAMDVLVTEAEAAKAEAATIDPRTRFTVTQKAAAAAPAPVAEIVAEPAAAVEEEAPAAEEEPATAEE